jgi:GTP-binding protein
MKIISAEFITSAVKPPQYPETVLPEIAFAGRSNVGKSSLINTLVNRKNLVKTSSTPGRTQLINFFHINQTLSFVDLPGFGYARVPVAIKKTWGKMIETYLTSRKELKGVVLLMDIRRDEPNPAEKDLIAWLDYNQIPRIIVLTKADKFSTIKRIDHHKRLSKALAMPPEAVIVFSAKTRMGKERLWDEILSLCQTSETEPQQGATDE